MHSSDQNPKVQRWLFSISGILLAIIGDSYWLIAWCLLFLFFGVATLMAKSDWQEMIPFRFLSYSGLMLLCYVLIRTFLVDYYLIPSSSMAPRLLAGDRVAVSKITYGPRLPNTLLDIPMVDVFHKLLFKKEKASSPDIKDYKRLRDNKAHILHNDLVVFNNPQTQQVNIKRCVGRPGDIIQLQSKQLLRNHQIIKEAHAFYGPLEVNPQAVFSNEAPAKNKVDKVDSFLIPGKGVTIPMTPKNFMQYESILLLFEGKNAFIKHDQIFIDGKAVKEYTFTHNYYYMLGDNRNNSVDSRYWGLLPQALIIGKANYLLYSNQNADSFFSRFLKPL